MKNSAATGSSEYLHETREVYWWELKCYYEYFEGGGTVKDFTKHTYERKELSAEAVIGKYMYKSRVFNVLEDNSHDEGFYGELKCQSPTIETATFYKKEDDFPKLYDDNFKNIVAKGAFIMQYGIYPDDWDKYVEPGAKNSARVGSSEYDMKTVNRRKIGLGMHGSTGTSTCYANCYRTITESFAKVGIYTIKNENDIKYSSSSYNSNSFPCSEHQPPSAEQLSQWSEDEWNNYTNTNQGSKTISYTVEPGEEISADYRQLRMEEGQNCRPRKIYR